MIHFERDSACLLLLTEFQKAQKYLHRCYRGCIFNLHQSEISIRRKFNPVIRDRNGTYHISPLQRVCKSSIMMLTSVIRLLCMQANLQRLSRLPCTRKGGEFPFDLCAAYQKSRVHQ